MNDFVYGPMITHSVFEYFVFFLDLFACYLYLYTYYITYNVISGFMTTSRRYILELCILKKN